MKTLFEKVLETNRGNNPDFQTVSLHKHSLEMVCKKHDAILAQAVELLEQYKARVHNPFEPKKQNDEYKKVSNFLEHLKSDWGD